MSSSSGHFFQLCKILFYLSNKLLTYLLSYLIRRCHVLCSCIAIACRATSKQFRSVPWFSVPQSSGAFEWPWLSTWIDYFSPDLHATEWSVCVTSVVN